jgi:hypothetical protein
MTPPTEGYCDSSDAERQLTLPSLIPLFEIANLPSFLPRISRWESSAISPLDDLFGGQHGDGVPDVVLRVAFRSSLVGAAFMIARLHPLASWGRPPTGPTGRKRR